MWQKQLRTTQTTRPVAMGMSLGFLALLLLVPVIDVVMELRRGEATSLLATWKAFASVPLKIVRRSDPEALRAAEEALEEASWSRARVQPHGRALLVSLGFGNRKVVLGREGHLYYAPTLEALRTTGDELPAAEAIEVIRDFDRQLEALGVPLFVLVVPDKAEIRADAFGMTGPRLSNRYEEALRAAGVRVIPLPEFGAGAFLEQDTHWAPGPVEATAQRIATVLADEALAGTDSDPKRWQTESSEVSHEGDLVDLLTLPEPQHLFAPEEAEVKTVRDSEGRLFTPSGEAPVLLLGDSFTNIYSDPGLGWGEGAGLAAQLAKELGGDVDVIAHNGGGATRTRETLARRPQRLQGKKAVVWQLSLREFAEGSWEPVELPAAASGSPSPEEGWTDLELVVPIPPFDPATTPYRDAVGYLKAKTVGPGEGREFLIATPAMREREILPISRMPPGARFRARLETQIPEETAAWTVLDETGEYTLDPVWMPEFSDLPSAE